MYTCSLSLSPPIISPPKPFPSAPAQRPKTRRPTSSSHPVLLPRACSCQRRLGFRHTRNYSPGLLPQPDGPTSAECVLFIA
eukprot:scaffold154984_cov31-Tisochrysis_lutea.AAC.1